MNIILVTGTRDADWELWYPVVGKAILAISDPGDKHFVRPIVIHGGAKGIDSIAGSFASTFATVIAVPAKWGLYGNSAGPRRNQSMLRILQGFRNNGDDCYVLAFHDDPGLGRGTRNMVNQAKAAGVRVVWFRSSGESEVFDS